MGRKILKSPGVGGWKSTTLKEVKEALLFAAHTLPECVAISGEHLQPGCDNWVHARKWISADGHLWVYMPGASVIGFCH